MNQEEEILDHLSHYGVRGMKWGVRRRRKGVSKSPDAQKKESVERKAKNKGVQALSNRELSEFNRRKDLENNYHRLNKNDPLVKKGHSHVKEILAIGATVNAAIAFASSPAGKRSAEFIKKVASRRAGKMIRSGVA